MFKKYFLKPGDPGCYAPFLLNVYHLEPGEAIYVPAGDRVNPNNLSIHKSKFGQCGIVNGPIIGKKIKIWIALTLGEIHAYVSGDCIEVCVSFFAHRDWKGTLQINKTNSWIDSAKELKSAEVGQNCTLKFVQCTQRRIY